MVPNESLRVRNLRHFTHEKGTYQIQIKPFQSSDKHEENLLTKHSISFSASFKCSLSLSSRTRRKNNKDSLHLAVTSFNY